MASFIVFTALSAARWSPKPWPGLAGWSLLCALALAMSLGACLPAQAADADDLSEISLDGGELDTTAPPSREEVEQQQAEAARRQAARPPAPEPPNEITAGKQLQILTTKVGLPMEQIGGSVSVITREQIRRMQATSLTEVLRQVPGVDVVQTGSLGSPVSIFIRGNNAEHTLVLLDGARMNDPISPGKTFNYIDQISADSVERVEVLRGPQGPLYGSDSIGGVINIITRQGEGKPAITARVLGGAYGTIQEDIGAGGTVGKLSAYTHYTRQDVAGYSAASNRYGNHERDGYHNNTFTGKLQYRPFQNWTLDAHSNYTQAVTDLDNFGGFGGDDPNARGRSRIFTIGGGSRLSLLNGRFEQITRLSVMDTRRVFNNPPDPDHPLDSSRSAYNGQLFNLDVMNNFRLHRTNLLTAGLNVQHEKGDSLFRSDSAFGPFNTDFRNRTATNTAFYLQDTIQLWNRWFTTLGMRSDFHDRFGHYTTYRVASTYLLRETGTRFKMSYGTGFKAPTLFQLYAGSGGNDTLNPETSRGLDAGIEQSLFHDKLLVGGTLFQNRVKNLIQFLDLGGFNFSYVNVAKARTQGAELYVTAQPFKNLVIRSGYTYTDTKDLSTGLPDSGETLLRRPRNKLSLNINYQPTPRLNLNLDITRMGVRNDKDFAFFPAPVVRLASYTLINLAASFDVTRNLNVFGRVTNLLDRPYEMVKGYGMPRISAYGGVRLAI